VEHGYAGLSDREEGRVVVTARRIVGRLHLVVEDDGRGLPEGFDLDGSTQLGLSIVRTLVESELGGVLEIGPGTRGTRVQADLPID
jgi:two-component sensor histidine kinase